MHHSTESRTRNHRLVWDAAGAAFAAAILCGSAEGATLKASATASVTILAPAAVGETRGLSFSNISRPQDGKAVILRLDARDRMSVVGRAGLSQTAQNLSAKFYVSGPPGTVYATSQNLTFQQSGLLNPTTTAPEAVGGVAGLIPSGGRQELRMGAGFEVTDMTPGGAYFGRLNITTHYN